MFETHSMFDTDPAFERPDGNQVEAFAETFPDGPQYNQFEHEDWMSDLRSLAAQSMAMNTNNRLDSSPDIRAPRSGTLQIQTPSVFPAAGPFEVPAITPKVPDVAPAVAPPGPSGRSHARVLGLLAGLAGLVVTAAFAIHSGMSRPVILHKSELEQAFRIEAATSSPEATDEDSASQGRRELPSPSHATAPSTPLGGPASAPMTPRTRDVERSNAAVPAAPPPGKAESAPAADAPGSTPPAPSPQTLAEAIERATGAKPAAPGTPPETAAPPPVQSFNRGAAMSTLRGIAGSLSSCKAKSAGSGKGAIRVTFAPSGNATVAVVDGGAFAGTPTGSCVARLFRSARVPPFSGSPVTVRQSFTIR